MQDISLPSMTQEATSTTQDWHAPELTLLDVEDAETGTTLGSDGAVRS